VKACVNAHWSTPEWVDEMLAIKATESPPEPLGWPVGTLVANKASGRRGKIWSRCGDGPDCAIEFSDAKGNAWFTTWDVVLRNYSKI